MSDIFSASQIEIMERAIGTFGIDKQMMVAIEEAGEFTTALSRYLNRNRENLGEHLIGETADILIMAYQIRMFMGAWEVDKMIELKLNKLAKRLDKNNIE